MRALCASPPRRLHRGTPTHSGAPPARRSHRTAPRFAPCITSFSADASSVASDVSTTGSSWSGGYDDDTEDEDADFNNYERRSVIRPDQPNLLVRRLRTEMRRFRVRGYSKAYGRSHILLSLRAHDIVAQEAKPDGHARDDGHHRCRTFTSPPTQGYTAGAPYVMKSSGRNVKWRLLLIRGANSLAAGGRLVEPELPGAIDFARALLVHLAAAHGRGPTSDMAVAHRCLIAASVSAPHLVVQENQLQVYAEYGTAAPAWTTASTTTRAGTAATTSSGR